MEQPRPGLDTNTKHSLGKVDILSGPRLAGGAGGGEATLVSSIYHCDRLAPAEWDPRCDIDGGAALQPGVTQH